MTADGSRVFFTTRDQLDADDTDSSADIYVDEIDGSGPVTPELVSVGDGGPSNSDDCHPVTDWNTVSGGPNCDAVAFAGGAGVAADEGTFYFVSPELLDGPSGDRRPGEPLRGRARGAPHFVDEIDSSVGKPRPGRPSRDRDQIQLHHRLSKARTRSRSTSTPATSTSPSGCRQASPGTPPRAPPTVHRGPPTSRTNHITGENLGWRRRKPALGRQPIQQPVQKRPLRHHQRLRDLGLRQQRRKTRRTHRLRRGLRGRRRPGQRRRLRRRLLEHTLAASNRSPTCAPVTNASYSTERRHQRAWTASANIDAQSAVVRLQLELQRRRMSRSRRAPSSVRARPEPATTATPICSGSSTPRRRPADQRASRQRTAARSTLYSSSGRTRAEFGSGQIAGSRGVAVNATNNHVYVTSGTASKSTELGYHVHAYEPIDNPAIVHGVRGSRRAQVRRLPGQPGRPLSPPSSSASPITSFDSFGHLEVYRYDAERRTRSSAPPARRPTRRRRRTPSCRRTETRMTTDGRVFFDSREPLVLRDTNGNQDAYEWKDGEVFLISSGTSPFDSGHALGLRRAARTPSSSPARSWPPKTRTAR